MRARLVAALAAVVFIAPTLAAQQDSTAVPPAAPPAPAATPQPADTSVRAVPDAQAAPADATSTDTTSSGQTHTVKKGDTLWDLAHTYLNDPFQWPEIYRLNTDKVQDPHWIYPGQVLRIPGNVQQAVADQAEPRFEPQPVEVRSTGPTVFTRDVRRNLSAENSEFGASPAAFAHSIVRPGEYYAAPWVDESDASSKAGTVVANVAIPGIAKTLAVDERLGPDARAYVTLPAGVSVAVGDYVMLFKDGAVLDRGRMEEPTAVARVEATGQGVATTVQIIHEYDQVNIGDHVRPLNRFAMSVDQRPAPVQGGLESKVVFVPARAVLPTVGYYVILGATSHDGVKQGDEFMLYRRRESAMIPNSSHQIELPEEPIALAQAVKVTDQGTTAIILDQRQPSVKIGVAARLTGKMP